MHFNTEKTYRFSEVVLYGFIKENDSVKLNAYILEDNNGWEAIFTLPQDLFFQKLKDSYPEISTNILHSFEVFFPDLYPDPLVLTTGDFKWNFEKSILEEDEEFGDEMIYFFHFQD